MPDLKYRHNGNADLIDLIDSAGLVPGRVLDCGCGAGDNARLLAGRGWRVTGITIDPAEADASGAHCEHVELGDLALGLPSVPDASFDMVVAAHVLEHLAEPAVLLAEIRRVLAPGGLVAVALPNVLHYRQRALFMSGRFEYTKTGLMDATHLRFFTVHSARRLLVGSGFTVVAARGGGGLPWYRLREVLPPPVTERADRWATDLLPNVFAWQSLFLARPVPADTGRPADTAGRFGAALSAP
jgi:SAM-dependent methyltransferase